jgi:hypothetical protein
VSLSQPEEAVAACDAGLAVDPGNEELRQIRQQVREEAIRPVCESSWGRIGSLLFAVEVVSTGIFLPPCGSSS